MYLALAIIFLIAWLVCFVALHVVAGAIHLLLALFVILLIVHFARGASRAA
ncbi:MAG TPA: DUF5670 family protein [Terriglobales bacterium]|nr:DUF5670 family protein [Terriglobales bacterium]